MMELKVGRRYRYKQSPYAGDLCDMTAIGATTVTVCIYGGTEAKPIVNDEHIIHRAYVEDVLEVVRGRPYVAGVDKPRKMGSRKTKTTTPKETTRMTPTETTLDEAAVRRIAMEEANRLGEVLAANDKHVMKNVANMTKAFTDVMRSIEGADAKTLRRVAIEAPAATGNVILDKLSGYYKPGSEAPANVLLASPPSLGKSYATRKLGTLYDKYMEHGCSDDIDEIATLLGGPVPDGKGGFMVVDGVLTEAVRTASEGQTVLLLLDEVLRLSPRAQEWLLTFMTGVKTTDGRKYRLRTRRAMPDMTLEVIECPAENLHIVGATNLGVISPVEAFWSRWETVRVEFTTATAVATASAILDAYGIEDKGGKLARVFSDVVAESRKMVESNRLRFPVDFRMLERAAQLADTPTRESVARWVSERLADNTAEWNVDTGDVDSDSMAVVVPWVTKLRSV